MERGTVLVVDDEPNIADLVDLYLAREGYRVLKAVDRRGRASTRCATTARASWCSTSASPTSTASKCASGFAQTSQIPVIFLTARDGEVDRVLGLELGGDDYLTKPFSPAELVARVKAVLRRVDGAEHDRGGAGGRGRSSTSHDERCASTTQPVEFTTKEFDLLRFLAERPGLALSRQQILDGVWGFDWFGDARTVDVHIAQVRKKLGDAATITTVRGVGYRFESPRAPTAS